MGSIYQCTMSKTTTNIAATKTSLDILKALRELDGAGVTELATAVGVSKGTIHNHLSTLESEGYVVKDGTTYRLGLQLFSLGSYTRRQTNIYEVAKPEIDALADETGEVANLMVEENGRGIYIYIARGDRAINLDTRIGSRQYLHTSALGKAILAHLPDERREAILDQHGLPAETPNTVTDREALAEELEKVRERGVAFDGEERAENIRCVAAPVLDTEGDVLGAVSISAPATRLKNERMEQTIPERIQDTATIIALNSSYP